MAKLRVAALIPALDCEASIAAVVEAVGAKVAEVLVVDDGSSDDTAGEARRAGAQVLRQPVNGGKGKALAAGLRWLAGQGYSHALTLDADGQHLASEAPKLLRVARAHPEAIVIGARRTEQAIAPAKRFGNELANLFVYLVTDRDFIDTQSGYRVYPIDATLALGASGSRFEYETEVLIRAARAEMAVEVVRVKTHYPPPDERHSHYDPLWDTLRIIHVVFGHWSKIY